MNYATLILDTSLDHKHVTFKRIMENIPENVTLIQFSGGTVISSFRFKSADFKKTDSQYDLEVKWNGNSLNFTKCWNDLVTKAYVDSYINGGIIKMTNDESGENTLEIIPALDIYKTNETPPCFHEWKKYTGLMESYNYCERCGKKK